MNPRMTVGLRSAPELADHRVDGAAILPGAWYLEQALRLFGAEASAPRSLWGARFLRGVVVSDQDFEVEAELIGGTDGNQACAFREPGEPSPCALVESDSDGQMPEALPPLAGGVHVAGEELYREM